MRVYLFIVTSCFMFSSCTGGIGTGNSNAGSQGSNSPSPTATRKPQTPATVNGKQITAEMSDAEILAAFDMNIKTAKSKVSRGPDGSSTTYTTREQTVSITRSAVTGVAVLALGPIKGDWKLGG